MPTFYWDFYGPDARPTAEHHAGHVAEFLARHGIAGATGVEEGQGYAAAWATLPSEHLDAVGRALRPRRWSEEPPDAAAE